MAVKSIETVDCGHPEESLPVFQHILDKIITQALIGGVTNEGTLAGLPPKGVAGKQMQEDDDVFAQMAEFSFKDIEVYKV